MSLDQDLNLRLAQLREAGTYRDPADAETRALLAAGGPVLDACSNDYLGLARLPADVSRETPTAGSGASRLVQGTRPEHAALEAALASWVGKPAALLFASGYAANVGCLAALLTPESTVLSDRLNHASLVDGCRLARPNLLVYDHLSLTALERGLDAAPKAHPLWVLTESYFSMDGDGPDLAAMRSLCDRFGANLVVDEAHSLGLYGREGAGLCQRAGVEADVLLGTLGKSVGTHGAFVAGSTALRTWLWNRARSFVFSTAPSPAQAALTLRHVGLARAADGARQRVLAHAERLRTALGRAAVPVVPRSFGPIVPLVAGSAAQAVAFAARLREQRILAQPIRPPTVPVGASRVRLTVTASLQTADVDRLADAVVRAWEAQCAS